MRRAVHIDIFTFFTFLSQLSDVVLRWLTQIFYHPGTGPQRLRTLLLLLLLLGSGFMLLSNFQIPKTSPFLNRS